MGDRTVVVTGAASGIGRATALRFAEPGTTVVLADTSPADEVASEIEKQGATARIVPTDVSKAADVDALIGAAGPIDVMVANAGISPLAKFFDITEDLWDRVHAVNLKGAFLCMQKSAAAMVEAGRGGSIVAVASVSAWRTSEWQIHYGAAKAGLLALVKAIVPVLAPHNIRVNAVLPGSVRTAILEGQVADDVYERTSAANTPLGRIGEPEEVAAAIQFLASEAAAFITGAQVVVDGGRFSAP